MTAKDRDYFRRRAITERALAKSCTQRTIAAIHEQLAMHYENLAGCGAAKAVRQSSNR